MRLLILEEFETGKHFKEKVDKECGFKIGDIYWTFIKGSYIPNKVIKIIKPKKEVKKVNKEIDLNKLKFFELKVVKVKKETNTKCKWVECPKCGELHWCSNATYSTIKPKGNWVNGENLDKIKFPCFCSYVNGSTKYYGEIHHSRYYGLYRIEGQDIHSDVDEMSSLRHLIEVYNIHILKGKILIYEEEN